MAAAAGRAGAALCAALAASACGPEPVLEALKLQGPTMGTAYRVTVPRASPADRPRVERAVRQELERVDALMSTYRTDSELSRFNTHALTTPYRISEETFAVLAAAQAVSEATDGAFDITVGPLVDAWGFGPDRRAVPPGPEEVARLRLRIGWRKLELDGRERTVRKTAPELQCDLSALAKGYAVDRVAGMLESQGWRNYLAEVGGELRARGANETGQPWRVGIERPGPPGGPPHRILRLRDTAVATSGDYRNFREVDGARHSHILDPRTGRPTAGRVASATVLDASAMRADAFATALLALGATEGLAVAEREGLAVLLLVRESDGDFTEAASSGFRARMEAAP